jgi:hypothetical protein
MPLFAPHDSGEPNRALFLMRRIAVGTLITERPPHRTVRAQFGHTAPTLGV